MRAERAALVLALALAARSASAQDAGREAVFGTSRGARFLVQASRTGVLFDSGPSAAIAETWDSVIVQGVLPDAGVRLQASRPGGPWVDLVLKRSADGRFWAKAKLGKGTGSVSLRALNAGVSADHEAAVFSVEVFQSGPEPAPSPGPAPVSGAGDPTAPAPPFKRRADWGASPASEPYSPDPIPWRVTLHHTDGRYPASEADSAAEVRFVQDFHMNGRGWSDIGYHFLIDPAGRIFEGRPLGALGAHTMSNNEGNVGIVFLGTYHSPKNHQATAAQLDAASALGRWLVLRFGLEPSSLKGHRDYRQTDCPGDKLYPKLEELRRGFAGIRAAKPIRPAAKARTRVRRLSMPAAPAVDWDGSGFSSLGN